MASYFSLAPRSASDSLPDLPSPDPPGRHGAQSPLLLPSDEGAALELQAELSARYDVVSEAVSVGDQEFSMLRVKDAGVLLERIDASTFASDERLPYWAEIWSSSIALAGYCLGGNIGRGVSVLDLGCGLGLAGIAAARAGARVTMTDYEEDALRFAGINAYRNLAHHPGGGTVELRPLDWRVPDGIGAFDAIIGSDIVYERRSFAPLLALLHRRLKANGRAVFTEPGRTTGLEFLAMAAGQGFAVETNSSEVVRDGRRSVIACSLLRKGVPRA